MDPKVSQNDSRMWNKKNTIYTKLVYYKRLSKPNAKYYEYTEIHQQGERCVQAWNILSTIPGTWLFTK